MTDYLVKPIAQPKTTQQNESASRQANQNERKPFKFTSFDTINGQISQRQYSEYWGNSAEYTQAIFNFYDTDGISVLSEEEFNNAKADLQKVAEEGMHSLWDDAIKSLLNRGVSKFSYTEIQKEAKLLEKAKNFVYRILNEKPKDTKLNSEEINGKNDGKLDSFERKNTPFYRYW